MEQVFHEQFYRPEPKISMADLAKISQKSSESVQEYLGRFREAKARCTVNMPEHEFAKLAQGGLLLDLRKKFEGIEFRDIYDLLLRVDRYEALLKEEQQKGRPAPRPTFYRDSTKPSGSRTTAVHAVDIGDIDSEERGDEVYLEEEEELAEVNLAEIVAKGPYVCKALSKASKDQRPTTAQMSKFSGTSQKAVVTKSYTFDISKAEQIFDQLLKEKIIKLSNDHDIPSANELRNKTYCKFHNVWSHTTNNCLVFRNADLINRKILKFPEKATMGVDQNPFPNAQVNMVNANFPRPDQPRPRLDLGSSARAAAKRRAREIPADPKAKGKAKLYPEVAKVPETKCSTKEEPPKAVVLCSRCQCEVTLEVVPPKPKEPTKEPAKGLIKEPTKDQVQVGRSRSFERNTTSPAENYGPHSPRGGMEVRPNKRPLHEYQDRYERPRYQPKRRNQHAPLRYEDIDSPYLSQNRSMWVSVGEGKSRDVACISRPRPADGNGVPTFKVPNTKAGQWYRSRGPKLPPVPLSKTQTRMAQRQYATTCKAELDWADKRQAQLDRLVELREKLRLEELELDKADAVASLEVAAAEEMKIRREWVNGRVVVTAPEEPILELEAHLTGAFEANNFKVEVSEPTKKRGDKPLRVQKARATPSKVKPPVAKALAVTKVAQPTKVENKEENDQNLVQEAGDEPHEILSEPRA
ncbi:unnamed protein product [Prunus brigantina]